jgi:hypothetical protein
VTAPAVAIQPAFADIRATATWVTAVTAKLLTTAMAANVTTVPFMVYLLVHPGVYNSSHPPEQPQPPER